MSNQVAQTVEGIFQRYQPPAMPDRATILQPVGNAMSRRVRMTAHAENIRHTLATAIDSYYETSAEGRLWEVDPDGRISPVPWGRKGYRRWKVKRLYADVIRGALMADQRSSGYPPLFVYDPEVRAWYLNTIDYPAKDAALTWLDAFDVRAETICPLIEDWQSKEKLRKVAAGVSAGVAASVRRGSR